MSHELRTPLNAIIGFSEVLGERMFGELNEKQAEYTEDILSSGRHLLSLINEILDLSKVEAGRMELELATFDLPWQSTTHAPLSASAPQSTASTLTLQLTSALGSSWAMSGRSNRFFSTCFQRREVHPEGRTDRDQRPDRATARSRFQSATPASGSRRRTRQGSSRSFARWAPTMRIRRRGLDSG